MSQIRAVVWTDSEDFIRRSLIPIEAPDEEAKLGVPDCDDVVAELESLGMPYETAKRLQNELRRRGFWTYKDVRRARATEEIFAALQSAYRTDVAAIINLFKEVSQ